METFGLIGFLLGSSGLTFAIIGWGQIADVRKELKALKKQLEDSGTLKAQGE